MDEQITKAKAETWEEAAMALEKMGEAAVAKGPASWKAFEIAFREVAKILRENAQKLMAQ